jgi:hypothetical protein
MIMSSQAYRQTARLTDRPQGDFVVFLIGMRTNKPWLLHKWPLEEARGGLQSAAGRLGGRSVPLGQ